MSWTEKDRARRAERHRTDPAYREHVNARRRANYAAKGPSGTAAAEPPPQIGEGLELKGQSVLIDQNGNLARRWDKSHAARLDEPLHDPIPPGHLVTKTTTAIGPDGRPVLQYVTSKPGEAERWEAFWKACEENARTYAGLAAAVPAPADDTLDEDLIVLIPLGDPHIGMLSWAPETGDHFDVKIASRELLCCVRELVRDAPPAAECIVTNLGDYLHAQDDAAMTPGHGNKLDVDGRFAKVLEAGHALLRGIVDACLTKFGRVRVRNLPGNHDPRVAAELSMWLRAVYEKEPRVIVEDAFAAHQYDRFGKNLFGWHHGDRSKPAELPAIMAVDRATDWGEVGNDGTRVWHTGHVHHLTRVETPGCVVESHRTLAARDAYHAGRYRAGRSLQAIAYHREWGEHSRVTVSLARVRAALQKAAA